MEITFLAHSSFKIKTKTATIITDPYDPKTLGLKFPNISAEIVCLSHGHPDHNDLSNVKDVRKVVDGPGEYEIAEVSIFGYPSFHDKVKGADRGKNTIYSIEAEGIRLVHLGDLGHKIPENLVEELGEVDVLMIPVGGVYTLNASEAVEVIQEIEPKIIIPMHFGMLGLSPETFGELSGLDVFLKESSIAVQEESKLVLKGALTEEQRIVVLKAQNG